MSEKYCFTVYLLIKKIKKTAKLIILRLYIVNELLMSFKLLSVAACLMTTPWHDTVADISMWMCISVWISLLLSLCWVNILWGTCFNLRSLFCPSKQYEQQASEIFICSLMSFFFWLKCFPTFEWHLPLVVNQLGSSTVILTEPVDLALPLNGVYI